MLTQKQKSVLSAAASRAIETGSGVQIESRTLKAGEFAPIASLDRSGGLIFKSSLIPMGISDQVGLCIIPVVDHAGSERLGLFIHGAKASTKGLACLAMLDPSVAGALTSDLMAASTMFSDPQTAASVAKSVADAAIALDLPIKEKLAQHSHMVIKAAMGSEASGQAKLQEAVYAAAIANLEAEADKRAAKRFAKDALALAEIAAEPRTSVRSEALEAMAHKIETIATLATK